MNNNSRYGSKVILVKFLQKDIDKFKKISDKRKYKKDSFSGKKRKTWNRRKRTKMQVTVMEGLAATDKGSFYNQQAWLEEYTFGEGLHYKGEYSDGSHFFF